MQEFEPFQKVIVRNMDGCVWSCDLYSHKDLSTVRPHSVLSGFNYTDENILPYAGNEHLLGTTDSPTPKWEPKPGESVAVRDVPDEEWKALPRTLRWTKEPPAEPGWYFCQRICPGAPKHYPLRVVHIHYDECMGKRVLCYGGCAWYGVEDDRQDSSPLCDISNSALEEMCWAGPILEPVK